MKRIPMNVGMLNTTINYDELIKQQGAYYDVSHSELSNIDPTLDKSTVKNKAAVKVKSYNPGFSKINKSPREYRGVRND